MGFSGLIDLPDYLRMRDSISKWRDLVQLCRGTQRCKVIFIARSSEHASIATVVLLFLHATSLQIAAQVL
jgi:hypothetical protein